MGRTATFKAGEGRIAPTGLVPVQKTEGTEVEETEEVIEIELVTEEVQESTETEANSEEEVSEEEITASNDGEEVLEDSETVEITLVSDEEVAEETVVPAAESEEAPETVVEKSYPEGEPNATWKVGQIDAWAADQEPAIEFEAGFTKNQKLDSLKGRND